MSTQQDSFLPFTLSPIPEPAALADTPATRQAIAHWRQSRQTFNLLLSLAPGVRQVIDDLLRDTLRGDPQHAGLLFKQKDSSHFVSLTSLCLYTQHHPSPPGDLDARATVQGNLLRPSEVYARLAALELTAAVRNRWAGYWSERDKGTPWSKLEHARRLYQSHFMAALEIVLNQHTLTLSERRPLIGLLMNPEWRVFENLRVQLEAPSCLPGALIVSLSGESGHVLYSPAQPLPFTAYTTRTALETALASEGQDPILYTAIDSISDGFKPLFEQLETALLQTLDHDPGLVIDLDASTSLKQADQLKQTWQDSPVLAQAPADAYNLDPDDNTPTLFDFGSLALDLHPDLRKDLVRKQMVLFDALDEDQARQGKQHQQALLDAKARAQAQVASLISSAKWHSAAKPVTASAQLVQAHRDGLLAHARLQRLLGQLDEQQFGWAQSVLAGNDGDAVAAQIELLENPDDSGQKSPLSGALLITTKTALNAPDTSHRLLLYWFGEHGGLLSCDNRQELERCLNTVGSLKMSEIPGDAVEHTLNGLLSAARQEKDTLQAAEGADAAAAALPRLRDALTQHLQVPRHAAREVALHLNARHDDVIAGAGASANRLEKLTAGERQTLRTLVDDHFNALRKAQAMIQADLPDRRTFCLGLINRRLRQDFDGYDNSVITVDLPLSTGFTGKDVVAGSGAPGTPVKAVLEPSEAHETLPLETLLLEHIDDTLRDRLIFMKLLVDTPDETLRKTLQEGIDGTYLRAMANELDLAGNFEKRITQAFMGTDDSDFMQAFRRETLIEPHRLILRLQNLLFTSGGQLDSTSQAMLLQVIDARSKSEYQANGYDLRLLAARLTSGGPDTKGRATTLAGITFIEDQISKTTLLYRPDHPATPLLKFTDLESARLSLFYASTDSRERDYLASRALEGNPAAHHSRLNLAHQHRFNGIIGIGAEWPATKSLADLQLDSHMGQLLQAHRSTSRSNLDLYLENLAAQAGKVLLGFKIALGALPVLGLPVSLYDLYNASAELVKAVSEGGTRDVLDAIQNVLVSIVDVGMDLIGAGGGVSTSGLNQAARQHRLQQIARPGATYHLAGNPQPLKGLASYQMSEPVSLEGLSPASEGRYRGVYRHDQDTLIQSHGRQYKVQWDDTSHTWELSGNAGNRYRRAIALDENGEWDTHLALYGVHRQGGGAGGGQALGHLADTLDPLWPAAVREHLPRWWRDQVYRRHNQLRDRIDGDMSALKTKCSAFNTRMQHELTLQDAKDLTLLKQLQSTLDDAKHIHADCLDFSQVSSGRIRSKALARANELAILGCASHSRLAQMAKLRVRAAQNDADDLQSLAQAKLLELQPTSDITQLKTIVRETLEISARMKSVHAKALSEVDDLRRQIEGMREWRRLAKPTANTPKILKVFDDQLEAFANPFLDFMELDLLLKLLTKPARSLDGGWINLQKLMRKPSKDLDRSLTTLQCLSSAQVSAQQRSNILAHALEQIRQFRNHLRYWQASYFQYFDEPSVGRLETTLMSYERYFTSARPNTKQPAPTSGQGKTQPRVFETAENQLLIGEADPRQSNIYRITGENGRTEIWQQDASGKFTLTNPDNSAHQAIRQATLKELQTEANRHLDDLDTFTRKIDQYATQDMDGASLQDLMQFKASDLEDIATQIAGKAPTDPLIARLRSASTTLLEHGRQLRLERVLQSRQPNAGQLDYLVEQDVVSIEKLGELVELKRTTEGRRDYLLEFVVQDKRQQPPKPLWYAHVHFNKEKPMFNDMIKAHLKTPAQRHLGREWQADHVEEIWRGDLTRAQAMKHLSAHF